MSVKDSVLKKIKDSIEEEDGVELTVIEAEGGPFKILGSFIETLGRAAADAEDMMCVELLASIYKICGNYEELYETRVIKARLAKDMEELSKKGKLN